MKRAFVILLCVFLLIGTSIAIIAHSGGTDGRGGHKGPGGYHYHHGYPAHDHEDLDGDGELDCPYDFHDNVDYTTSNDNIIWSVSNKNFVPALWVLLVIFAIAGITTIIAYIVHKYKDNDFYAYPLILFLGLVAPISFVATNAYNLHGILNILCGLLVLIGLFPFACLAMGLLEFVFFIPVWIYKGCKAVVIWFRDNSEEFIGCLPGIIFLTIIIVIIVIAFVRGEDSADRESDITTKSPTYDYKAFETWKPIDLPPPPNIFPYDTY